MAFSVARTTNSITVQEGIVGFDKLILDFQSRFNLSGGVFQAPRRGIYVSYLSLSSLSDIGIYLKENDKCYSILLTNPFLAMGIETIGRSFMRFIESNLISKYAVSFGSLSSYYDGLPTSWTMFMLDDIMQPLVAFSVTRALYFNYGQSNMIFDTVLVNQSSGWNSKQNRFIAPVSGIYFMSLVVIVYESKVVVIEIQINENPLSVINGNNLYQNVASYSNSFLVPLSINDNVTIYLRSDNFGNFLCNGVNFIGFLYEPVHGVKVAWSVHRTTGAVGPLEPVNFDYVMVNIGYGWNNVSNTFSVPISGVYYLHINANNVVGKIMNFQIMWNRRPYVSLFNNKTNFGIKTQGRAIMANLTQGDIVYVKLWEGTEVYSDIYKQTSFSGFFLYPNY